MNSIKAIGSLSLKQLYPLRVQNGIRTLYNDNLFSNLEFENTDDFLRRYVGTRNESTNFDYELFMTKGTS